MTTNLSHQSEDFGSTFERIAVGILAITTGLVLANLAIRGPLCLHEIIYKTAPVVDNQLVAQDFVNLFLLTPISLLAGIQLIRRRRIATYLLMMMPLFLIYYSLSYTIGWEWSSPVYQGNSQNYTFHFLFVLIASLIILLYALSVFPKQVTCSFKKTGLIIYSVVLSIFLLIFAGMWCGEVVQVIATGTTRGYDIAPAAFWLVRTFDLGFTIPLGLLSVYLLWTRPATSFHVQFLFYGFFLTMIIAVNAMGIMMLVNNDPTFSWRDLVVFLCLAGIIGVGFGYIMKNCRIKKLE